jgi:hypothetical protein
MLLNRVVQWRIYQPLRNKGSRRSGMDTERFDAITKRWTGKPDRRKFLKGVAVGVGGLVLGALTREEALAFNPCNGTGSKGQFCEQCCGAVNTEGDIGRCVRKCRDLARNP